MLRRFGRALESGPTLMVAEDLQWASVAAIRLLETILALHSGRPLLVVATQRTPGTAMPSATEAAFGELMARHSASTLHLGGLGEIDLSALLAHHGHRTSGPTGAIATRTGGVPLLALAAARGEHVFLAARLSRVSPAATAVAQLLAVAGELPTLDWISGLPTGVVHEAVEELIDIGFVRSTPRQTAFTYPVFREAIEARLSPSRRATLLRRLWVSRPNQGEVSSSA